MCLNRIWRTVGAATAALAFLVPASVAAYDFRLVPSVGVREEYNNNLYFSETDREDSWLLTVNPGADASWRTERSDGSLTGKLEWLNYQNNSDLDTTDYFFSGRFTHQLTPKVRLAGTGSYRRESRPDRHFEEAGLVDASRDYRHDYAASAEWLVTEKTAATLSYAFEWLDYPAVLQRDARVHNAGIGFAHALTRFTADTKARMNLGYIRGDYEDITTDTYTVTVGMFRAVHELWSVLANVGVMHTRSDFADAGGARTTTGSTGVSGDASLIYKGERTFATFTFFHGLAPAYGQEGAALRTSAVASVERQFLYDVSGSLSAGFYRNTSDAGEFSTDEIDERSARVRPSIRWKPSKYIAFDASYMYTWIEKRITDSKATQTVAYAGVVLSYPLFDE